ncbi:MAG: T9SS type A sorting domain-containing protein [Candidatus Stahlbacteria bacterium]|nr:T9SS type A sorting domain-containing protein [Candidatus Stahlbacteria bacterium]
MWYILSLMVGQLQFERIVVDSAKELHGVWVAKVNGDNRFDILATAHNSQGTMWYEQTVNINLWQEHWVEPISPYISEVCAGDFDGDGDQDEIHNECVLSRLRIGINNGTGVFGCSNISHTISLPRTFIPADINNDGRLDFAAGSISNSSVYWFRNNGGLSFTQFAVGGTLSMPVKIDVFDANGDGHCEIIASEYNGTNLIWYDNNGSEVFTPRVVTNMLNPPMGLKAGDFDADGDYDVAVCENDYAGRVIWCENTGAGFTTHPIESGVQLGDGLDIGDIDLDGDSDIVVCNYGPTSGSATDGSIRLYRNNGAGIFTLQVIDDVFPMDADLPFIVDIDEDSCPDIVMSDFAGAAGDLILYHQICPTSVEEKGIVPTLFCNVFPIPATRRVDFNLSIPETGECGIKIYDMAGNLVYRSNSAFTSGKHILQWNTKDCNGKSVPSGIYFYKIGLNNYALQGKLIVARF